MANGRARTAAMTRAPAPSARDRAAARRSLGRFKTPLDVRVEVRGSAVHFAAALQVVETLLAVAAPLSPALEQQLAPWLMESYRRRSEILADNRVTDAHARLPAGMGSR